MSKKPITPELSSCSDVLNQVMRDKNYLVGSEPENSEWDFSNWPGFNFEQFGGWVLAEKFFSIPTLNQGDLSLRIVKTDPNKFPIDLGADKVGISFLIEPVKVKQFPTILIGKDSLGNEKIIRRSTNILGLNEIPEPFRSLADEMGELEGGSKLSSDPEADNWAEFIKLALKEKKVFPTHFAPTEFIIRDFLELGPTDKITEELTLLAEMQIIEQELLMLAFADFVVTQN